VIILVFGTLGGFLIQSVQGFSMSKLWKFPGFKVRPLLKTVKIPPLVGMIIFGMIARNFFGEKMLPYNATWTSYLKYWCYCTLLIRAGLNLDP
jgi:NhaP-type Na+/H+ or K+/H+ antiporter